MFLTTYYYYYYYYYYYCCCCCCRDKDGDVDPDVMGVMVLSRVVIELSNCGLHESGRRQVTGCEGVASLGSMYCGEFFAS